MTAYMNIAPARQVIFQVSTFIFSFAAIYCVIMAAVLHLKTRWIIFSIGLFLFGYLMLQPMIDITYHLSANSRPVALTLAFGRLPAIILLGMLMVLWTAIIITTIKIRICRNTIEMQSTASTWRDAGFVFTGVRPENNCPKKGGRTD